MRKASFDDINNLSQMLLNMYNDVSPEIASKDIKEYVKLSKKHLEKDDVWIDERGFFIMRDETLNVLDIEIWNGVSVYVKPEYRNTKALKDFYEVMFKNYNGAIMGYTEKSSKHNAVLLKRHNLMGYVYALNRPILKSDKEET